MTDIEDKLRKINELGSEYEKKSDDEKEELAAKLEKAKAASVLVKEKLNSLETTLTHRMPFEIRYAIGETSGVPQLPMRAKVYLVKTIENKINVRLAQPGGAAFESYYTMADHEILAMITDQKIEGFLNAIQEELKKNLSK